MKSFNVPHARLQMIVYRKMGLKLYEKLLLRQGGRSLLNQDYRKATGTKLKPLSLLFVKLKDWIGSFDQECIYQSRLVYKNKAACVLVACTGAFVEDCVQPVNST